ncbi:MAG: glycosyltransferase [Magnetococcales bacterium]|nr:glycosyltransferase [Magnetococcales bacterium]NGZ25974.1 glycosyltransferase [Magnetococcales bacterium]
MTIRVLHLLDHSWPLRSGYAVRSQAILRTQVAAGFQVALLTSGKHPAQEEKDGEQEGITYFRTPYGGATHGWQQLGGMVTSTARRLLAVCQEWGPQILHAHSPALMGLVANWVGWRLNLPVVYEIRAFWEDAAVCHGTTTAHSLRYWLTRQLETRVVAQAEGVVAICQGIHDDLLQRGLPANKLVVAGNGAEPVDDTSPAPLFCQPTNSITLGYLGSLYHYEGLHLLLEALALLRNHTPRLQLCIMGEGPEKENLQQQARQLGIAGSVDFLPARQQEEACQTYRQLDICVFPRLASRLTQLVTPLKPLEAMAHQRLVIASDVGGHKELIRHGETGLLVPADNPHSLATTLQAVSQHSANYALIPPAAQQYIRHHRTWQRQLTATLHLYDSLLARKGSV